MERLIASEKSITEGCICQRCGKKYKVDFLVDNDLWELIKPKDKDIGAGLLCGECIIRSLEGLQGFGAYKIVEI